VPLAAATALARCGNEHLTKLAGNLQGNGVSARMPSAIQNKRADDLVSNDIAPNIKRKMVLKMCLHGCVWIVKCPDVRIPCINLAVSVDHSLVSE